MKSMHHLALPIVLSAGLLVAAATSQAASPSSGLERLLRADEISRAAREPARIDFAGKPRYSTPGSSPVALGGLTGIEDGSLELGGLLTAGVANPFWAETGTHPLGGTGGVFWTPICNSSACGFSGATDGTSFALFGGLTGQTHEQTLSQSFVITTSASELNFDLNIDACDNAGDVLTVELDGNVVFSVPCIAATGTFDTASIDLATAPGGPYNDGGTHTLTLRGSFVSTNGSDSRYYVDQLTVFDLSLCGNGAPDPGEQCDDGNSGDSDGCSSVCVIETGYLCTAALPSITEANTVEDGSLELGGELTMGAPNPFWAETGTIDLDPGPGFVPSTPICNGPSCLGGTNVAFDGDHWAWFGGFDDTAQIQTLEQTVTVPADASTLTFELLVGACDSPGDSLTVTIDGNEVFNSTPCTVTGLYVTRTVDLVTAPGGPYNDGAPHSVIFTGTMLNNNGGLTNYWLDLAEIGVSVDPPIPPVPSECVLPCSVNQFEDGEPVVLGTPSGLPADWTTFAAAGAPTDVIWGATNDGFCGSLNWPAGNYTGGSGVAACIDTDAPGGSLPGGPTNAYLCSDAIDLSAATGVVLDFGYNYQRFGDNSGEDLFEALVGTVAPNAATVGGYGVLFQTSDNQGVLVGAGASESLSLAAFEGQPEVYVCFHYVGDFDWYAQVDNVAVNADDCGGGSAAIGGTLDGALAQGAQCRNVTTGDPPTTVPGGAAGYDCTAAGLAALPGDVVGLTVRGIVLCGNPGGTCDVSETLQGVAGQVAQCTNVTTGQSAVTPLGGGSLVSCNAVTGGFTQGDTVQIRARSIAQ